jgi:hypothetical protein
MEVRIIRANAALANKQGPHLQRYALAVRNVAGPVAV